MKLINLTGTTLFEINSKQLIKATEGNVVTVDMKRENVCTVGKSPIYRTVVKGINGLPEPQKGVIYIVTSLALNGVPKWRKDVVAPGNLKRKNGIVVGCDGFRTN